VSLRHILEAILAANGGTLFAAALATGLQYAKDAADEHFNPVNEVKKTLTDFVTNLLEGLGFDPDQVKEAAERTKKVYEAVKTEGESVFAPNSEAIGNAIATGQIPNMGDAGLGQTHDNFTPGGDQFSVGQTPGIDIGGVGLNRSGDGGDGNVGYGGGSGGGGSTGSSPTPLGGSGSGAGASGGGGSTSTAVAPPTAGDLGLDPNSGAYIEYQPTAGQVQITYPDGTTETRPWPPQ